MTKHHGVAARDTRREAMGWLRIMRLSSVLGEQHGALTNSFSIRRPSTPAAPSLAIPAATCAASDAAAATTTAAAAALPVTVPAAVETDREDTVAAARQAVMRRWWLLLQRRRWGRWPRGRRQPQRRLPHGPRWRRL